MAHRVRNGARFTVIWAILHPQGILYLAPSGQVQAQNPGAERDNYFVQLGHGFENVSHATVTLFEAFRDEMARPCELVRKRRASAKLAAEDTQFLVLQFKE